MDRKPRLLVVDDEIHIRTTLEAVLRQEDFDVETASGGNEAVAKATAWRPDLVLSDVVMPDLDGIAAAILISESVPDCRIVLLSGHGVVHDLLQSARERGYEFDVLLKPIHPLALVEHLRRVLRRS